MAEVLQIALWIGGGFFLIISGLLGWIGMMYSETKKAILEKNVEQDERLNKHDDKFEVHQKEIHALAIQNMETLTVLKHKFNIK